MLLNILQGTKGLHSKEMAGPKYNTRLRNLALKELPIFKLVKCLNNIFSSQTLKGNISKYQGLSALKCWVKSRIFWKSQMIDYEGSTVATKHQESKNGVKSSGCILAHFILNTLFIWLSQGSNASEKLIVMYVDYQRVCTLNQSNNGFPANKIGF